MQRPLLRNISTQGEDLHYSDGTWDTDDGPKLNYFRDISSVFHLTATEDKFYYTVPGVHTVKCCNFEGKEIRVFENRSLKYPGAITVAIRMYMFQVVDHTI